MFEKPPPGMCPPGGGRGFEPPSVSVSRGRPSQPVFAVDIGVVRQDDARLRRNDRLQLQRTAKGGRGSFRGVAGEADGPQHLVREAGDGAMSRWIMQ